MRKKFLILACCVFTNWAAVVSAQNADTGTNGQDAALQALRQAEAAPVTNAPASAKLPPQEAPPQIVPADDAQINVDKEVKEAIAEKKRVEAEEEKQAAEQALQESQKGRQISRAAQNDGIVPQSAATQAATTPAGNELAPADQAKVVEAVRRSETGPISQDQTAPAASAAAVPTTPPLEATPVIAPAVQAQVVAPEPAREPAPSAAAAPASAAEAPVSAAPVAPATAATELAQATIPPSGIVAPEPAITPAAADDQAKALEALRRAEAQPITTEKFSADSATPVPATAPESSAPPAAAAPAPTEAAPVSEQSAPGVPMTVQEREALLIQLQKERQAAEEKASADAAAREAAAAQQRQQDDLRLKQAIEAEKAAAEQARLDQEAQAEAARKQQEQDDLRVKQAVEAERAAVEAARVAKAREEAIAAAARKKAAEEAAARQREQEAMARRVSQLNGETKTSAKVISSESESAPVMDAKMAAKQRKLAELLRRYDADEITPLEYHTARAKILAEP
jgi:hypothetical protein